MAMPPSVRWTFDGSLADSSGNGLHAKITGTPQYVAAGRDEQGLWLTVNGDTTRMTRDGLPTTTWGPLRVGPFHGEIDNLHIENPRPAVVRLRNLTAHAVLLYAGQPIRVSADVVHYAQAV